MKCEAQDEHRWLHHLIGDWRFETECQMGPDQPPMKTNGSEIVRSLGGLWTIGEAIGEVPDGATHTSIMTLGYDPARNGFVGTFVSSMMTHLWPYFGQLNSEKTALTLESEGPSFTGQGVAKYRDTIEIVDDHHRILYSELLGEDGQWTRFMTGHYYRKSN